MASRDFVITTDTTSDLPLKYLEENNIKIVPLYYNIDGDVVCDNTGEKIKEFYAKMRNGAMPTTMACNPEQTREIFEEYLKKDYDILHIAFSSALSSSYNNAKIVSQELSDEYPDAKIIVIDSLCASMGEGLLVYKAVEQKKAGKNITEIASWVEENKLHICHQFTVDDLYHLFRGGRVSKTTAVIGTIINVKPILHVDDNGELIPVSKIRGRKKSLNALVDLMEKTLGNYKNDIVFISHGDAIEDAEYVADRIKERFGIQNFLINTISPTIAAHAGPGTIALFYMGQTR